MLPTHYAKYQAYAAASQTAPKTRQIVMLYDGAIRYLQQAQDAIEQKRVEDRFNLLVRASDVIMGLQGCLDFESGGEVAKLLFDFYSSIDSRMMTIHRTGSVEMCTTLIKELKDMRDVWHTIDQRMGQANIATVESPTIVSEPVAATDETTPTQAVTLSGVEISA